MANTLYVFLHGTICLIEYVDYYRGIVIDMEHHRVSAGNFLTERTIRQGDVLRLEGVPDKQTGTLDRTKNIVASVKSLNEIALHIYRFAEVILPKPNVLHSIRTGDWQSPKKIKGSFLRSEKMGKYSGVQIFEYLVADLTKVQLKGKHFLWNGKVPTKMESGKPKDLFCSLHIFDEPEADPVTDDHFIEEFNRGCRILGVDLRMNAPLNIPDLKPGEVPTGIVEPETMSLVTREQPVFDLLAGAKKPTLKDAGDRHYCGTIAGSMVS